MFAVLAATVLATVLWNLLVKARAETDVLPWGELLGPVLDQILHIWPADQIGVFGWGDVGLPEQLYLAWKLLFLGLGTVAFAVGTWRQRLAPVVLFFTYVAGTVALVTVGSSQTGGFAVSPRYVQPAFLAFPIVWGEVILLNRDRLPQWLCRTLVVGSATVVAVANGVALLANSRRFSVGTNGPWSYLIDGGQWTPPGGWLPWMALTVAGAAVLVVGFAKTSSERRDEVPRRSLFDAGPA